MFDSLSEKVMGSIKKIRGQNRISESNIEDTLKEIRMSLLEADVNFKVVKKFHRSSEAESPWSRSVAITEPRSAVRKNCPRRTQSHLGWRSRRFGCPRKTRGDFFGGFARGWKNHLGG